MKLIVGLGNPGEKYKHTRHNIGYLFIDQLLKEHNINFNNNKFNGEFTKTIINGENVVIARPLTFMNNSGKFVSEITQYFGISRDEILIIIDDKDQHIGRYKLVNSGGSGGHNGIKDISQCLQTNNYMRLKIGIGNPFKTEDTASYVLSKFNGTQKTKLNRIAPDILNLCNDFPNSTFKELSNKYANKGRVL